MGRHEDSLVTKLKRGLPDVCNPDDCWMWQRAASSRGYGAVSYNNSFLLVHRVVYVLAYGEIPQGHDVHHTCNNKLCVNPAHLITVVHDDHRRRYHRGVQ
jgi:hypothetical protein